MRSQVTKEPLRWPPRQQYTSGRQFLGLSASGPARWRAMFSATIAPPMRRASKAERCL